MSDYNVKVYDGGLLIEEVWTGDCFDKGQDVVRQTSERLTRLIKLNEIQKDTTRIVLAQHDGTVEEELIV